MAKKWGEICWEGFGKVFWCYSKLMSLELWFPKGTSLKTNQCAEYGRTDRWKQLGSSWAAERQAHYYGKEQMFLLLTVFWIFLIFCVRRWRRPNINHPQSLSQHHGFQDTPTELALNPAVCPDILAPLLRLLVMAYFEMSFDLLLFIVLAFNL